MLSHTDEPKQDATAARRALGQQTVVAVLHTRFLQDLGRA